MTCHLTFGALLIKGVERANPSDLLELEAKTWNDGVEFLLYLGILGLIRWKMLERLIHCDESVLDTLCELNLARHLLGLEGLEEVEEQRRKVLGKLMRHKYGSAAFSWQMRSKASINATVESKSGCSSVPIVSKTLSG